MNHTLKEKVYALINGFWDLEHYPILEGALVENVFRPDEPCSKLYYEMCEARGRLYQRLGSEEDTDIDCIIDNMTEIMEIVSLKMFDYGVMFAPKYTESAQ